MVPKLPTPIRIQEYGAGIFTVAPTKSALKKVLKKGWITVNGVVATTATLLSGHEQITLAIPEESAINHQLNLKLEVLFEDEHLAVINKPAGIIVSGNQLRTVANALAQNLIPSTLPNATKPQPVHRLDHGTSGVLLTGKTTDSIRALNKMFEKKRIKKSYYAITIGAMPERGSINAEVDNKPAQSDYCIIDSVDSERFGKLNLVRLTPHTGRRHQLRIHMSELGNPILGDSDYGIDGLILKGKGMYLHAYSLEFKHPFTNETLHITSELPKKFKYIFKSEFGYNM